MCASQSWLVLVNTPDWSRNWHEISKQIPLHTYTVVMQGCKKIFTWKDINYVLLKHHHDRTKQNFGRTSLKTKGLILFIVAIKWYIPSKNCPEIMSDHTWDFVMSKFWLANVRWPTVIWSPGYAKPKQTRITFDMHVKTTLLRNLSVLRLKILSQESCCCFLSLFTELGLTGVPVFNTNNNCSSASSALMLARLLVLSGQYRCVLALGRWKHYFLQLQW